MKRPPISNIKADQYGYLQSPPQKDEKDYTLAWIFGIIGSLIITMSVWILWGVGMFGPVQSIRHWAFDVNDGYGTSRMHVMHNGDNVYDVQFNWCDLKERDSLTQVYINDSQNYIDNGKEN